MGIVGGLGIEQGQILRRGVTPLGDTTLLEIITLRPGRRQDVLRAASRDIFRAGYELTSRPNLSAGGLAASVRSEYRLVPHSRHNASPAAEPLVRNKAQTRR